MIRPSILFKEEEFYIYPAIVFIYRRQRAARHGDLDDYFCITAFDGVC